MKSTSYKNILIAIDGSELAEKALTQGLSLAKLEGAKVIIITVSEAAIPATPLVPADLATIPDSISLDEYIKVIDEQSEQILKTAKEHAKEYGVACTTSRVKDIYPADGILDTARLQKCDLIVMGSHGYRGVKRILLGSQAQQVVTRSEIPVLVCR